MATSLERLKSGYTNGGRSVAQGMMSRFRSVPFTPNQMTVTGFLLNVVAAVLLPQGNGVAAAPARVLRLPVTERLADPETRGVFAASVAAFEAAGLMPRADTADLADEVLEQWFAAFRTVQAHEAWASHGSWIEAHPGSLGPDVAARFATAAAVTGAEADAGRAIVVQARERLRSWLEDAFLILPTVPGPAPLRKPPTRLNPIF